MSNPSLLRTPPHTTRHPTFLTPDKLGATPTRAGDNFTSSTSLGHTQQEIKSSLYGRIFGNEPGIIKQLVKPELVDSNLVAAIEQALGENAELKAARDLLFENKVPEKDMYMPMVKLLRHISTFNIQPKRGGDTPLLDDATPKKDPAPSVSTMRTLLSDSSPATSEQRVNQSDNSEPLSFPDAGENHGLCTNRTWVDTHASLLHTDHGLFVSVRGVQDADEPKGKRARGVAGKSTRSKVAKSGFRDNAATASHSKGDDPTVAPLLDNTTPLAKDETPHEEYLEKEAVMDDRKPDISLIDLPHSDAVPAKYLWRQCAVFMEVKKNAWDGPLGNVIINARLPEDAHVPRDLQDCRSITSQMADNARILMATRPFLRFCLHIVFCGTNFNLALFDRNGIVISRSHHFETHLGLFIRIIRRLSCEMTAYDLGLDTTVRPEGCLGSAQYPSYLVKISDETWYRTEGVPLWQSTSLLGRGTLVFRARKHSDPDEPLWILKHAWREDGRLKESALYELMRKSGGPFESPRSLAEWIAGGDVPLHSGMAVTIGGHRALFGSKVIGNGATVHRLILASRGKSLGSYTKLKQLLKAAWAIVVAHRVLNNQGILHGDLSYGNTFLRESPDGHFYGFLADLDLASVNDVALGKLPTDTAETLRKQKEKGPRSGTVIFMAVELLRSQVRHLKVENAARKKRKDAPLVLSVERQAYHDLEAFLWVLVYAMMIHNYNSLTNEADRKEYKETLDKYFGHGGASVIVDQRQSMMYLARSSVADDWVSQWFPDVHERRFFIRCMTLIAEHDMGEEERDHIGTFKGEISEGNPVWNISDDESASSPDEDAEDQSGTYKETKATKGVQKLVARLRKRPPVITYESVVGLLEKSIAEL